MDTSRQVPEAICARLCHGCGGELEQIRFLLGHASVQTTERYIGSKQKLQDAVNNRLGISVASDTTLKVSGAGRFAMLTIAFFIIPTWLGNPRMQSARYRDQSVRALTVRFADRTETTRRVSHKPVSGSRADALLPDEDPSKRVAVG